MIVKNLLVIFVIEDSDVEKIVGSRLRGKRRELLIKWEGFSEADNTWEPSGNIPQECILEFDNAV